MNTPGQPNLPSKGQFLVYQAEDGRMQIDVRLENETAWLTQSQMAELFQTTIPNVNIHIRNIFAEGELQAGSVIKEFLTTAADGKNYSTKYYNLDAIISVGYRVKSAVATRFRIWADQFVGVNKMGGGAFQSQRDCVHQPRVARNELPWVDRKRNFQPQRGCIVFAPMGCNPFRVEDVCYTISQGSSCLATLGWMMESLWDSRTGAPLLPSPAGRRAGDEGAQREQTIAGNVAEILEA